MDIHVKTAYGTAVVGYDLLASDPLRTDSKARVIKEYGLVGGGAAGDTAVEIFVGGKRVATQYNSSTGDAFDKSKDLINCDIFVPANALIQCKVIDAAPSGNVNIGMNFKAPTRRTGGGFRKTARRTGARRTTRRSAGGGFY